jgi:hypothetical protein
VLRLLRGLLLFALPVALGTPATADDAVLCHNAVPDVEFAFWNLNRRPEALGARLYNDQDIKFSYTQGNHVASLARYDDPSTDTPYFYLSWQNKNDFTKLLTIRMGSRAGRHGERMGCNRLSRGDDIEDTAPPYADRWAATYTDYNYWHSGGIHVIDGLLFWAIASKTPDSTRPTTCEMLVFDISEYPYPGTPIRRIAFTHEIDPFAITKLSTGDYLLFACGENDTIVKFYTLNSSTFTPTLVRTLDPDDIHEWHTNDSISSSFQSLTFVREAEPGDELEDDVTQPLCLVALRNSVGWTGGRDEAYLFRVTNPASSSPNLQHVHGPGGEAYVHVDTHPSGCEHLANFAAAGTTYVSPTGELILYGSPHDNEGPDLPDPWHHSLSFAEFRLDVLYRPDSPLWRPRAEAGGPYAMNDGGAGSPRRIRRTAARGGVDRPLRRPPWLGQEGQRQRLDRVARAHEVLAPAP